MAAIVAANATVFVMAMSVARHARSRNTQREKDVVGRSLAWLKGAASLLSIMGLTWFTGFLYLTKSFAWMGIVFTLLNSLQGLAIFLLHVAFNAQVRQKLRSHLQRQFHILEFHSLSRNTTVKSTMRSRRSELSLGEDSRAVTMSVELSTAELDKSQGEAEVAEVKREVEANNNLVGPGPEPEPDY